MTTSLAHLSEHPQKQLDGIVSVFAETQGWELQLNRSDSQILGRTPIIGWGLTGSGDVYAMVGLMGFGLPEFFLSGEHCYRSISGKLRPTPPECVVAALTVGGDGAVTTLPEVHGHVGMTESRDLIAVESWTLRDSERLEPLYKPMHQRLGRPKKTTQPLSARADYVGLLTAEQAEQVALGGPLEARFLGLTIRP